jgi:NAD(P)-dependent dehydrogenase (short-subunit alcohol dehydrogenase family)
MGLLDGKVAIITGAGRGIGRAEAHLLASEGAKVIVNDRGGPREGNGGSASEAARGSDPSVAHDVAGEIAARGGTAISDASDVSTREGAAALVARAVDAFGRLDILINNAGILRDKTLLKMDEDDFDDVVRVHLKGSFLCTQAAARQLVSQREGGRIVQTTSVSGLRGNFGQANYAAAKAGIYGLTRTAAIELQKHRVTVNAIAPIAKTRMTEDLPMFEGMDSLTPEHVAPAALFLASDLCGDRTGLVLAVSGAHMYGFKLVQTAGQLKEEGAAWTAAEIAQYFDAIMKS